MDLPRGPVTFLFTDIEGSTRLLHELGAETYADALAGHRRLLREAFARHDGVEVDTQGDAFFYAFPTAAGAIAAAQEGQEVLASGPISIRVGLHTGSPHLGEEGYVGEDVHLGARIAASAHGGQVVLSQETRAVLGDCNSLLLSDLGEHRLKDFAEPVWLYQLGSERFPPLKTISNTNLPRPASSFVGREREVAEVVSLLREASRLVTLSGPGGSGKTRLGIEAAAELVPEFRNGVFWVGLADLRDPALVPETIAQTLGAKVELAEHIGERELLLLLDNFEQLVEAAPDLTPLLEACPHLRLLITSRELLRVRGEVEYPVPPLAESEAVELFRQRSRLEPSEQIAELCARLDDLPLAVELAAARTSVLSPAQILERLAQRLDLLKGGRDAEVRQQTLRATIEWSYELLTAEEQQLFARLSVFAGGCTLEAAEEVAEADLDTLQSLVDKSLLRHTEERFWMLETIREYAEERFAESSEADELCRKYAEFFRRVADSSNLAMERLGLGEQRYDLVIAEQGNMRAAIDWALGADPELGLRIACALEQYWITNNSAEGLRLLTALLDRARVLPDEVRVRGLRCLGGMVTIRGDFDRGTALYEEALALYKEIGDERGMAHILMRLAFHTAHGGDRTKARSLAEESLAISHRNGFGFRTDEAQVLNLLGDLAYEEERYDEAFELLGRSAELCRETGFRWWETNVLRDIAELALKLNRLEEARAALARGLAIAREIGDRQGKVVGLALGAWLASATGQRTQAGRLWGAIEAEEESGGRVGQWELVREEHQQHVRGEGRDPDFEAGVEAGRRLSLDQAVAEALHFVG